MSSQGLWAHYPATQQSLLRGTKQIMRKLKENTSATGSKAATMPPIPLGYPKIDISPKIYHE